MPIIRIPLVVASATISLFRIAGLLRITYDQINPAIAPMLNSGRCRNSVRQYSLTFKTAPILSGARLHLCSLFGIFNRRPTHWS